MDGMSSRNDTSMHTLFKFSLPHLPGRFQKCQRKDEAPGSGKHLTSVLNRIFNTAPYTARWRSYISLNNLLLNTRILGILCTSFSTHLSLFLFISQLWIALLYWQMLPTGHPPTRKLHVLNMSGVRGVLGSLHLSYVWQQSNSRAFMSSF